jgi:hypothetical protein
VDTEPYDSIRSGEGEASDNIVQSRLIQSSYGAVAAGRIDNLIQMQSSPWVRTAYRKQIERIAPPKLVGRDAEFLDLVRFCTNPTSSPYFWLKAPAWAGKSALLSTLVLHPPPGVRIVSFFITARLADQDTREAFTQVLTEQLADLLDQPLPMMLTDATREAHLLDLLERGARKCARSGERLILVVDGLDEERTSVDSGRHSIAALLPSDPPEGLRVIIAGRPDPPIPDDVPLWHPMREVGIVHSLEPSGYARDIEVAARQELKRLLRGTPAEKGLLGFLVAARGSLSAGDLVELTGRAPWEIDETLRAVSGRFFTRRDSAWRPSNSPSLYLLCHEELYTAARKALGEQQIDEYGAQLNAWADRYRVLRWPSDTPEYLLRGYFRMLVATGDLDRVVQYGTDLKRHDRMLGLTGGDTAALGEVSVALKQIAAQDGPDLLAALHLARHRDYLLSRNIDIPAELPALWAAIGEPDRGEALARSIKNSSHRTTALTELARQVVHSGRGQQAQALISEAEITARSLANPAEGALSLAEVAVALAQFGDIEHAVDLAFEAAERPLSSSGWDLQADMLARVADVLAEAECGGQLDIVLNSIERKISWRRTSADASLLPSSRKGVPDYYHFSLRNRDVSTLVIRQIAQAIADDAGDHSSSFDVRSIADPDERAFVLAEASLTLTRAGKREAARLALDAETASQVGSGCAGNVMVRVSSALANAHLGDRGAAVARSVANPWHKAQALAAVANALARAGDAERAIAMATEAEGVADSLVSVEDRARPMLSVARVFGVAGRKEKAVSLVSEAATAAHSISHAPTKAALLVSIAHEFARLDQRDEAAALAVEVETISQAEGDLSRGVQLVLEAAGALARAGHIAEAQALAMRIASEAHRLTAVRAICESLARCGQSDAAMTIVLSMGGKEEEPILATIARGLAGARKPKEARDAAHRIFDQRLRQLALLDVAAILANVGLLHDAEAIARSLDPETRLEATSSMALGLAYTGEASQAERLAMSIGELSPRHRVLRKRTLSALSSVFSGEPPKALVHSYGDASWAMAAGTLTRKGRLEQAEASARSPASTYWKVCALLAVAEGLAELNGNLAAESSLFAAEVVSGSISDTDDRARALVEIANVAVELDHPVMACRIAAEACAIGRWTVVVGIALTLIPEKRRNAVVRMIVDMADTH